MTNRRNTTFLATAALVPLTVLALAAFGGTSSAAPVRATDRGSSTATVHAAKPKTKPATVRVVKRGLGKILVDSNGRTLYLFGKDTGTMSQCTAACATKWPPLVASGKATVSGGAKAAKIRRTTRSDGTSQITYNGHPLYTFAGDQKAGDTNGQGINAFGGIWSAVSASGNRVSNPTPTTSGGGGSGY